MEFDRKEETEFAAVVAQQDQDVKAQFLESEILPAVREEPAVGPSPLTAPEKDAPAPDPTALHHWIDDLHQWEDAQIADPEVAKLVEKLEGGAIDDLRQVALHNLRDTVNAPDEQKGLVPNFLADTAIEGAGLDVQEPGAADGGAGDDPYLVSAAYRPFLDDEEAGYNGGGGGGGGNGGGWPGDNNGGGGNGDPPPPPDDDPKKKKAAAPAATTPKEPEKPAPAKPEKKGFFRKRSGDD